MEGMIYLCWGRVETTHNAHRRLYESVISSNRVSESSQFTFFALHKATCQLQRPQWLQGMLRFTKHLYFFFFFFF